MVDAVSFFNFEQYTVSGTAHNDTITGGAGNDSITTGLGGRDVVDGGAGNFDNLQVSYGSIDKGGGLTFNAATGTAERTNAADTAVDAVSFSNFEQYIVSGTAHNDNITGGAGNDRVTTGLGGQDVVDGGAGNFDNLFVSYGEIDKGGGLTFDAATGTAERTNAAGTVVDAVIFSDFESYTVSGTIRNDNITGGANADVIIDDAGNDNITGNAGNDTIISGAGNDRLRYDTGRAFTAADLGVDSINDFTSGTDKFILNTTTFTALAHGSLTFEAVNNDAAAAGSSAFIVYNTGNGNLFYNQNGATAGFGTGAQFATLQNSLVIAAEDFLVYR